jgi:hypothetical protein
MCGAYSTDYSETVETRQEDWQMYGKRALDSTPSAHYRSDRLCSVNGEYFFATREGTLEGPFYTRVDAERSIAFYIRQMQQFAQMPNLRLQ